jgi:hypothetical protein
MRGLFYILSALAVIGLASWAYRQNYTTQQALREVGALQREIAGLREALSVQRAEWAYLNRPERLAELAALNFDRLQLLPLDPSQFGAIGQVVYPPILPSPARAVDVSSQGEEPL